MDGRRRALFALCLLIAAAVPPIGAGEAATRPETDSTVTRIEVAPDGTAAWEVQIRTRLPTEESRSDYERFQERFRENTSRYLDPFRESMTAVVAEAANATGREMRAESFRASTTTRAVPRRYGVVSYEFTWTDFAARDGDALVVGDVFRGHFYLTENDTLEIVAPDTYAVSAAEPDPDGGGEDRARWSGQQAFDEDRPTVRFEPVATETSAENASVSPDSNTAATDDEPAESPPTTAATEGSGEGLPISALGIGVLLVGALSVGAVRYVDGNPFGSGASATGESNDTVAPREEGGTAGPDPDRTEESGAAAGSDRSTEAADSSAGVVESADDSGSPADGGDSATDDGDNAADGSDEESESTPAIVTDEDRVLDLLERNDGQLRQSEIVDRLDWSKSKTSRVLSGMADDGEIEKLRIGRENVIRLADLSDADE